MHVRCIYARTYPLPCTPSPRDNIMLVPTPIMFSEGSPPVPSPILATLIRSVHAVKDCARMCVYA